MSRPFGAPAIRLALVALTLAMAFATALAAPQAAQAAEISAHVPVNLRSGPGTNYRIITLIPAGARLTLTGDPTDGFYPVVYNGASGWAYGTYLTVSGGGGGGATVVTSVLNLRSGPGLGYRVITGLPYGTTVEILDGPRAADGYNWAQVRAGRAGTGWVANAYLSGGEAPAAPKAAPAPAPAPPAANGGAIVAVAMRYVGSPYVWAGASPSGFDCSGFTMYVVQQALGRNIGRSLDAQLAAGTAVSAGNLAPGDLVFFQNTYQPGLSHVGIYIGGGQMVNAASERYGVAVMNIWDGYWGPRFYAARRL